MSTTWRKDPFKTGQNYRVRKTFKAFRDTFKEGEVLRYRTSAYSHYDGMSGFFFDDESGKNRSWDIHDDVSLDI